MFFEIIKSQLDIGKFDDLEMNLSDSNIDSLSFVKIIIELEEKFGIEFEDEILVITHFKTFRDLYTYVEARINAKELI